LASPIASRKETRAMKRLLPLLLVPLAAFAADSSPVGSIERLDPALDKVLPKDAKLEKLCEGFNWSEGPVWKDGAVLFSDVPENIIYQWKPGATKADVFLKPSGMTTPTPGFREQGSNGLALDLQGRLLICQHGDRRIARFLGDGKFETIADKYEGKRFNSPNDLAVRNNGEIYFTDPPYGLDKLNDSPLKEIPFNGVYRVGTDGKVLLVIKDLTFPNGIAFSPDEKRLYVAVSDQKEPRIMAYDVQTDGTVANGKTLFDAVPLLSKERKGSCDGLKVDATGNIWATGPGGVLIISPEGKHLGTILTGEATGNCTWGDDGSTIYITADMYLGRVKTSTKGVPFGRSK
jgi:gluconolactonase